MLKKYGLPFTMLFAITGYLISSCSKYDERSALAPVLYFEKDGRSLVFAIIKYGKTVSYRSDGGSTYKQLNTNYFIQCNDAETGELITNKKIMHSSKVKFHPVITMGSGNGKAWVFIGELLAYDPFTLEKFADKVIIETKNPQLKGKMPDENTYYTYNKATDEILITATDGIKYRLSTSDFTATPVNEDGTDEPTGDAKMKQLEKNLKILDAQYKANYDNYRAFNKLFSEKKINYNAYTDSGKNFNRRQKSIDQLKKAVQAEIRDLRHANTSDRERKSQIENLNYGTKSYSNICTAVDTFNGTWYGLLSNADLEKPDSRFRYRLVNIETARNKLYKASVFVKDSTKETLELEIAEPEKTGDMVYLQGGFLLNKKNALPLHLKNDDGFIICYREKAGNKGNIMLARVDLQGNAKWSFNTNLTEFADWIFTGSRLIIMGNDNKNISSGDANLLISLNLQNGKAVKHDYFTNSMRKE